MRDIVRSQFPPPLPRLPPPPLLKTRTKKTRQKIPLLGYGEGAREEDERNMLHYTESVSDIDLALFRDHGILLVTGKKNLKK